MKNFLNKFRKLTGRVALVALVVIGLGAAFEASTPTAHAQLLGGSQVNPMAPVCTGFSNCPPNLIGIAAGNSQTNLTAHYTNAIRLRPGRDLTLISQHTLGSNTVGNVLYSFGLVYGRTNTTTTTNFTWTVTPNGTAGVRSLTNIPSSVFGNADGVFIYSALNTGTNTYTGLKLFGQQFP